MHLMFSVNSENMVCQSANEVHVGTIETARCQWCGKGNL